MGQEKMDKRRRKAGIARHVLTGFALLAVSGMVALACTMTGEEGFEEPSVVEKVHDVDLFELEGNAVEDGIADDWETLWDDCGRDGEPDGMATGCGGSFVFTGIADDPAPQTIFDGGKKDIQDVSQWSGGDGSVPDKNDITNAYAAAYKCPAGQEPECTEGDLIVYFGADRVSNNGDAFLGFWFFKDAVSFDPDTGEFSGTHMVGDTLVLVNFPQATNAVPEISVVSWDPTCSKADSNDPVPGDCAAKNLRLEADGAVCGDVMGDDACAITNAVTETSPWPFQSKNSETEKEFPFESFFEGGINLTRVIGGDACFASFMAETRSSSSFTAALKDFVLGEFPVCAVELSKQCGTGTYNPTTGNLEIPYTVTITNTGSGSVNNVVATDDDCGFGTTTLESGLLVANASVDLDGTCFIPSGTDLTGGVVNGVSAVADGGEVTVVLAGTCMTDPDAPGTCFDPCTVNTDPMIDATKSCVTALVAEGDGVVKVKVNFSGTVTNTSDQTQAPVPLTNVAVEDDKAGALTLLGGDMMPLPTPVTLEPGESANFVGSYLPDGTGDFFSECPSEASFMDTVTARGDDAFFGETVEDFASATCALCPPEGCPTP